MRAAGRTWKAPQGNVQLDGKANIWFGSGIYIEFAQSHSDTFSPPATALLEGLIAEGIPAKGHTVTQGADPSAIHIVIGSKE